MFFDYELPQHLIAQEPLPERDGSRLLVVRKSAGSFEHRIFHDLAELLNPGDLLVLNNTQVLPARLLGRRSRTGGKWEGLFLRESPEGYWEMLSQTRGRLLVGETIDIDPGPLKLTLITKTDQGHWLVQPKPNESPYELFKTYGHMPLPPYIRKGRETPADIERYQTVYALQAGAIAAPTAGLHFTPRLLDQIRERGISTAYVTLHVGLGTFQPIQVEDFTKHKMHREWCELPAETVTAVEECRSRGNRVIAVGTTSVRVLESVAAMGPLRPWAGETHLFIYPPYDFRIVNGLITNFHLPKSTLLLLVSAFTGIELIRQAYMTAIDLSYRFYSYGDAMLIV